MKADTFNLVKVFGQDARYVVPLFQRPYVWNCDDNWTPLWEDVRRVAGEIEDGTAIHPHFLGTIVLASVDPEFGQLPTWEVVDGQQRLTTLQLLLAAARDAVAAVGDEQPARLLSLFIDNNEVLVPSSHPEARWKVWPTRADQTQFVAAMSTRTASGRLVEARSWFESQIREWLGEGADPASRVAALVTALRERLRLVVIDLEKDDDAQVIFETLNGRGTPLEAADLVKNLLFRAATRRGESVDALYAIWAPFDGEKWRRKISVGRQFRSRLDVFLTHWLSMRTLREVTASTLYAGFSDWIERDQPAPSAVFSELARYAQIYDSFDRFEPTSHEGRFFDRLNAHQTTTPLPLLLHVYGRGDEVTVVQRCRFLTAVDSFLMRRAVCGLTTKDYNNLFRDVLAEVASEPSDALDVAIVTSLASRVAESRYWPTDDQFRRSLETERLYRTMVRARLRTMLEGIEHELRKSGKTEELVGGTLTVEHVLPRAWQGDDWPLPIGSDPVVRNNVLHSLGNLTLVTGRMNSTLSNHSWANKQEWLATHSLLRLTTGSVLNAPPTVADPLRAAWASSWDESRITARGAYLADIAVDLWPDPTILGGSRPAVALPESRPADVIIDDETAEEEPDASGRRAPLYERFWSAYLTRIAEMHPGWTRATVAPRENWLSMPSGVSGVSIIASFARRGRLRHELYIDRGSKGDNKALFDHLHDRREQFESEYGRPLEWERLDNRRASRIAEYGSGKVATTGSHDEYMAFFDDAGERLRRALMTVDLGELQLVSPGGRRVYSETLATLLERGDLVVGDQLTDRAGNVAIVLGGAEISVDGNTYESLSDAAEAVTGHSTNGWAHWFHHGVAVGSLRHT